MEPRPGDEPEPWALSLVVRVERFGSPAGGPPARTDALVAAARAVVALLVDPRTTDPGGELHDAVARWRGQRIRKIARRARGARWDRTASLPHVGATAGTAVVRAFAPHPRDDAPGCCATCRSAAWTWRTPRSGRPRPPPSRRSSSASHPPPR